MKWSERVRDPPVIIIRIAVIALLEWANGSVPARQRSRAPLKGKSMASSASRRVQLQLQVLVSRHSREGRDPRLV